MFDQTLETELGVDATSGVHTTIKSSKKLDILPGIMAGVTSQFSKNVVVTGIGRTAATVLAMYGAATLTRMKVTGQGFTLNPLAPL